MNQEGRSQLPPGLLCDRRIRELAGQRRMIEPFVDHHEDREGVISFGLSSYGYDARVAEEFQIFAARPGALVDPKNFDRRCFTDFRGPVCTIPPHSFALARTVERFRIPADVFALCVGKSTYARCGIITNTTPFEPGWEGQATLEIANASPLPARIYAGEGIAQVLFFACPEPCQKPYPDRGGKYQSQGGICGPRI